MTSTRRQNDPSEAILAVEVREGATGPFRIKLPKGLAIRGKVSDRSGRPIADAYVHLQEKSRVAPKGTPGVGRTLFGTAYSGADGSFSIVNLEPGSYELECDYGDLSLPGREAIVVKAGTAPVSLVLVPRR